MAENRFAVAVGVLTLEPARRLTSSRRDVDRLPCQVETRLFADVVMCIFLVFFAEPLIDKSV
jgi:hypothetical protein